MKNPIPPFKSIGKKIEDFHWIYIHISPQVAQRALESSYGYQAEEIFEGLKVYHQYGMDVYLNPSAEDTSGSLFER